MKMSELTALDLARTQFAFTIAFHIIFPAITIGLASYLAVPEGCWLHTKQPVIAIGMTSGHKSSWSPSAWASCPAW